MSFPHRMILSLYPKAANRGCVLPPQGGTTILSLCPKAADHECVLPSQGDDDPIAMSQSYQSCMCPSSIGGRQSRRYVLKLSIMDVSFPPRGTMISMLQPNAVDRGCVPPPQREDDPVATSCFSLPWIRPSPTGER
jgi:hypothetical protein